MLSSFKIVKVHQNNLDHGLSTAPTIFSDTAQFAAFGYTSASFQENPYETQVADGVVHVYPAFISCRLIYALNEPARNERWK